MQTIVQTLEAQHRALEKMAQEIESAVQQGQPKAVAERLAKLGAALSAHLGLENAQFYPAFEQLAQASARPQDAQVARLFADNMGRIAEGLSGFLARYREPPADLTAFARDWSGTAKVLVQRIASEEQTLHPMFDRLAALRAG